MPTSERISKYRDRLDKTLASPNLTNAETLKTLLKNHLQQSSLDETEEELLNRRTEEVLNFIDMLRSASVNNHVSKASQTTNKEWKLKQDNEEFRVMYREGPEGTPFHTLLVEGYIDGPMDRCLCVSWESALYKKWWPQYTVPAFKITSSQCLHKIRIGENISSVRVKVSWPLSSREAIVHCFEFEYLQDDLIIVILNSISETEEIDKSTHGYSRDMIPEAKDVIRIGVVGGFAMQKVTPERSYFRTIANVDLKLDFVPPSLINFISRQLIGSGFRLYQKAVASVFNSDEEFKKALGDSLYTRIREGFYSKNQENGSLEYDKIENKKSILIEEEIVKVEEDVIKDRSQDTQTDEGVEEVLPNGIPPQDRHSCGEIEEVKNEDINEESSNHILNPTEGMVAENSCSNGKRKVYVSPEVEEALGTLEKVISMFRQYGLNVDSRPSFSDDESQGLVTGPTEGTISENGGVNIKDDNIVEASKKETMENPTEDPRLSSGTHSMRGRKSSSSGTRDVHHNKVAPAFPEERLVVPDQINHITVHTLDSSATQNTKDLTTQTDFATESDLGSETKLSRRWIKHRLCCFHPVFQH